MGGEEKAGERGSACGGGAALAAVSTAPARWIGCLPADELIRQVTVNCAERGLVLLRVRDEIRTTIGAYTALYESSIAFGMRKTLTAEQKKAEMQAKVRRGGQE